MFTTGLVLSPWVRLTYLFTDETVDKLGHGTLVFSCHKCGDAKLYHYKAPLPLKQAVEVYGENGDPEARKTRDAYEEAHLHRIHQSQ